MAAEILSSISSPDPLRRRAGLGSMALHAPPHEENLWPTSSIQGGQASPPLGGRVRAAAPVWPEIEQVGQCSVPEEGACS
jgi:hypothetical protein